jgi:hypothetical protein
LDALVTGPPAAGDAAAAGEAAGDAPAAGEAAGDAAAAGELAVAGEAAGAVVAAATGLVAAGAVVGDAGAAVWQAVSNAMEISEARRAPERNRVGILPPRDSLRDVLVTYP